MRRMSSLQQLVNQFVRSTLIVVEAPHGTVYDDHLPRLQPQTLQFFNQFASCVFEMVKQPLNDLWRETVFQHRGRHAAHYGVWRDILRESVLNDEFPVLMRLPQNAFQRVAHRSCAVVGCLDD